jgi:hypothetical protein
MFFLQQKKVMSFSTHSPSNFLHEIASHSIPHYQTDSSTHPQILLFPLSFDLSDPQTIQNCVQRLKVKLDIDYLDENHTSPRLALCMEAVRRKLLVF